MRIAITGGGGRVGRAVIELALRQGHRVVSIDRATPVERQDQTDAIQIQADITDYHAFERALHGCDALVHLAAIPAPRDHPDYVVHNNNVVASYNALSAAASLGITRVCQASSVNAIGGIYSRWPRFDYFPLDEQHPTYSEDPYSLSKWICEQQADAFARRYETMTIASLRLHGVMAARPARRANLSDDIARMLAKNLWGYTRQDAVARACLLALTADLAGHETFYIVAPDTVMDTPSLELKERFFPEVPVRGDLSGNRAFTSCEKARRLLGWSHDET
jgi:UDP-glucose 4-epimerase